jgi:hypothetical protein
MIVGEPRERDHQSRYRRFGIADSFFDEEIRPLHRMRDNFDVAHLTALETPSFLTINDVFRCRSAASSVLKSYLSAQVDSETVSTPREDST